MSMFTYLQILVAITVSAFQQKDTSTTITCNSNGCTGVYEGAEFIDGSDVAHQFSNSMSAAVGDELKLQYRAGNYVKVDLEKIEMYTPGMGSGYVTYSLKIPFEQVSDKCEAYTSFDHCGGWNHTPALERRKRELRGVTLPGESLLISNLKTTPEGLEEYWIQWKNKDVQAECIND